MYHEFIKIKKEDIPNRFNYNLISNYTSIKVSDDIILNNSLFLKGYNTFKVYWHNKGEGLDYYGNTIIFSYIYSSTVLSSVISSSVSSCASDSSFPASSIRSSPVSCASS